MADEQTFNLTPDESLALRRHDADAVEVEVTYQPGAKPPPKHLHPAQSERFEVLAGRVTAPVDGAERTLRTGDTLEIGVGAVHQMWNSGPDAARAIWETRPAGRTLEWFGQLDRLQREGKVGKNHMPGPLVMGALLTEYRDVLQVAVGPRTLVRGVMAVLGFIGRRTGRVDLAQASGAAPTTRADTPTRA